MSQDGIIMAIGAGVGVGSGVVIGNTLISESDAPGQPRLGATLGGMAGAMIGLGIGMTLVSSPAR